MILTDLHIQISARVEEQKRATKYISLYKNSINLSHEEREERLATAVL